jgi:hypothetical protein
MGRVTRLLAISAVAIAACASPQQRFCGAEDFVYHDLACATPSPSGGTTCAEVGDGLCHLRCTSDADCIAEAPFCRTLGLYAGGDFNCNATVQICRDVDQNDCTRTTR